jgi:hypothetical protein
MAFFGRLNLTVRYENILRSIFILFYIEIFIITIIKQAVFC